MMSASPITIRIDQTVVDGELEDTPTAQDLLRLLPLELALEDFNGQEKLARLPHRLTTQEAPDISGAEPGDIGYYSPSQHIVLYYARVAAFPGIVRIGHFADTAIDLVRDLSAGTSATIVKA